MRIKRGLGWSGSNVPIHAHTVRSGQGADQSILCNLPNGQMGLLTETIADEMNVCHVYVQTTSLLFSNWSSEGTIVEDQGSPV